MKKYIVAFAILSFILLPVMAGAISSVSSSQSYANYSIEELESLIAKLQKQLEEMKRGAQCFVSDKNLSLGDGEDEESKADVVRLQEFLREKGHFNFKKSTGYFGKITKAALVNFQKNSSLDQTGELDENTRVKIKTLRCKAAMTNGIKKEVKNTGVIKEEIKSSIVNKIIISANGKTVLWKTDGYSKNGFKIVWSKNSGPVYPIRDGDKYIYLSEPSSNSIVLEPFNGEGKYYARVCEYLGGKCGIYSNEISLEL